MAPTLEITNSHRFSRIVLFCFFDVYKRLNACYTQAVDIISCKKEEKLWLIRSLTSASHADFVHPTAL